MYKRWNNYDLTADVDMGLLLNAVLRKMWIVIVTAVLSAVIACTGIKYLVTPQYHAAVMLYVNNANISAEDIRESFTSASLRTARGLVDTYIVLLHSRTTLKEVIDHAGISDNVESVRSQLLVEIAETLTAESVNETEIFRVIVKRADAVEAERIANAICEVLPRRISEIMDKTSAKIVDAAVVPSSPATPNLRNGFIVGGLFGAVLGVWIIVRRELFDGRVKRQADLQEFDGIPLLAAIPDLHEKR